jgi:hypothetical protein
MPDLLITSDRFDVLHQYHATLTNLPKQAQWLEEHLGISTEPSFVKLYKPSLDETLRLVSNRLGQWPDLFAIYPKSFHDQQRLNADIRLFNEIFESTIAGLPSSQRRDYLSTLDLRQIPFLLEGKLLVLTVGPAWPFAQQLKNKVAATYSEFYSASGVINQLDKNNREILPRYVDFMKGAVDVYIDKHTLDPNKGDARTAAVNVDIAKLEALGADLVSATHKLAEGFTLLFKMQEEALKEFSTLFSTISITNFQLMVDLAIPALDTAEKMARP